MQYVRSISGTVSKTWNSINPGTLSGAIDVIVVEQEDGTLACSPFHVRFGKYQILRPSDKKVEFAVNGIKQDYPMKLGDGGEAFFIFETSERVPEAWQTSPLASPSASPEPGPATPPSLDLAEPEPLDLSVTSPAVTQAALEDAALAGRPPPARRKSTDGNFHTICISSGCLLTREPPGDLTPRAIPTSPTVDQAPDASGLSPLTKTTSLQRSTTDQAITSSAKSRLSQVFQEDYRSHSEPPEEHTVDGDLERPEGPPSVSKSEAVTRAITLSKRLWNSNIPTTVTETGDLMLDITAHRGGSDDQALRAEVVARKLLSEEIEGDYDIGALIGVDVSGNVWIYSSEEAKDAANRKAELTGKLSSLSPAAMRSTDALSDPGYHSDEAAQSDDEGPPKIPKHMRHDSDSAVGMSSTPHSPEAPASEPLTSFAKTIRLTSEQLQKLNLHPGLNNMTFTVNRGTLQGFIYLWKHDIPIVVSDIDGTITKSDVLGQVLTSIGRDWTHVGVAKLYTDIAANGYNILYLTSRGNGQADTTRAYLNGIVQDGYKLPKGPVIMSPDRTMAALRREVYLRKPEVFKMAALRDIMTLYSANNASTPFYAGFGNRFTDALSYRSVNIPQQRIFTINSNAEVSLDLLSLNKYKTGYVSMRELVDHFFPPVSMLIAEGGEEFTDFNYWRDRPLDIDEFSASEFSSSDEEGDLTVDEDGEDGGEGNTLRSEDEGEDLSASYMSRDSIDSRAAFEQDGASVLSSVEGRAGGFLDDYGYGDPLTSEEQSLQSSLILDDEETTTMLVAEPEEDDELIDEVKELGVQDATPRPTLVGTEDIKEDLVTLAHTLNSPRSSPRK